jgi:hypothetical protein
MLRRVALLALFVFVGLAVLSVLGLVTINVYAQHQIPRLIARAARSGVELQVRTVRIVPFLGVTLRGVTLGFGGGPADTGGDAPGRTRLDVGMLRVAANPATLLRLGGAPGSDRVIDRAAPWRTIDAVIDSGLVPRRVVASDGVLIVPAPEGFPREVRFEHAGFRHEGRSSRGLFTLTGAGAPSLHFRADVDYARRTVESELVFRGLMLSTTAVDAGVSGTLGLRSDLVSTYEFNALLDLDALVATLPAVAPEPVGPLAIRYEFSGDFRPILTVSPAFQSPPPFPTRAVPPGRLTIATGDLLVNGLPAELTGVLRGTSGLGGVGETGSTSRSPAETPRTLALRFRVPDLPTTTIKDAIPEALLGELVSLDLAGTFGWDLDLRVDLERIGEMSWRSDLRLEEFAVRRIGSRANPYKLNESFVHVIEDPAVGYRRAVRIPEFEPPSLRWMLDHSEHTANQITRGRAAERAQRLRVAARPPEPVGVERAPVPDPLFRYVRLEQISPWVTSAVLTAEDGDFFFHDGVNFYTLPRALERNVRAGETQYGASTLSMQLVKMLFLCHDRILSRKLQEAFLVFLMEQDVPVAKSRILEIYLNIVEFGPGVFGIADASRYYFNRDPFDLTVGEATWLASILPSPKRYHQYYEAGRISDGWFERMIGYYEIMLERGRMTSQQFQEAVDTRPSFRSATD